MHRFPRSARTARCIVALGLLMVELAAVGRAAASPDVAGDVARARSLWMAGDGATAVDLLETALTRASLAEQKIVLSELRRAYPVAIAQAERAGDSRKAKMFKGNLEILGPAEGTGGGPKPAKEGPPVARGQSTEVGAEPAPSRAAPEAPEPLPPTSPELRASVPPANPGSPVDGQVRRAGADRGPAGPGPMADPAPIGAVPMEPAPPVNDLASADTAFREARYEEAGRMYAGLAREGKLPSSRNDHWAYCRCVEVVRRINAQPSSTEEWAAIHGEIRAIRALAPKNWFGEYLRNLAAQRSTEGKKTPRPSGYVVRGADPDKQGDAEPRPVRPRGDWKPEASLNRTTEEGVRNRTAARLVAGGDADEDGPGRWQVRTTTNFRILHDSPALAERVAVAAEEVRDRLFQRWTGRLGPGSWSPRCDIYLYPTASDFGRRTGQPESTPGFSTMGLNNGRVVARRINLRADHGRLVEVVLPHELTHVVLADLFPETQIPRWADEGLSMLSEPEEEQEARGALLSEALRTGQLFRLQTLMTTDYPDPRFWDLFCNQSVSLTRFLIELGSAEQLIRFLQGAQRTGFEAELARVYNIQSYEELEAKWIGHARNRQGRSVADSGGAKAAPSGVGRFDGVR